MLAPATAVIAGAADDLSNLSAQMLGVNEDPIGALKQIEALEQNAKLLSHLKKNDNGNLGKLPNEILQEILPYSTNLNLISVNKAKVMFDDAMENPDPGPKP